MGPCNPTGLPSPGRHEHSYQYHPGRGGCKGEKQMPAARGVSPVNSRCAQLWTTAHSTWVSTSSYVCLSSRQVQHCGIPGLPGKARPPLCPRCERLCISSQTGYIPTGPKPVPQDFRRALLCDINKRPTWVVLEGADVQANRTVRRFPLSVHTCSVFPSGALALLEKGKRQGQGKNLIFHRPLFIIHNHVGGERSCQ